MVIIVILMCIFLTGCTNNNALKTSSIIEENGDLKIAINYPVTGISKVDKKADNYVDNMYDYFINNFKDAELNIDFKIIQDDETTIKFFTYINSDTLKKPIEYTNTLTYSNKLLFNNKLENTIKINDTIIDYNKPVVALTFDDGPSIYTKKIIDILNKYNAKATFFILGNKVDIYNETIKYMNDSNHEIGNHSYNHKWLTKLDDGDLRFQIDETNNKVFEITKHKITLLRPTYGAVNKRLRSFSDLKVIMWDVDSNDWRIKSSNKIVKNLNKKIKDGSIVLMHDTHKRTIDVIDKIIPLLKEKGYQFVTVSELEEIKQLRNLE